MSLKHQCQTPFPKAFSNIKCWTLHKCVTNNFVCKTGKYWIITSRYAKPKVKQTLYYRNNTNKPALSNKFCAVGCHSTRWTLRICASKVTTGSVRFTRTPSSGICHIIIVQSSEQLAMMSSLWGHHLISRTAALCPLTKGWSRSTLPVWKSFCNK